MKLSMQYAIEKLNTDLAHSDVKYRTSDFHEGIYRTEPTAGAYYELFFRDKVIPRKGNFRKVVVARQFSPIELVTKYPIYTKGELINLILPLAGRIDRFRIFMRRFGEVCILGDGNVFLTVVYFGTEGC